MVEAVTGSFNYPHDVIHYSKKTFKCQKIVYVLLCLRA